MLQQPLVLKDRDCLQEAAYLLAFVAGADAEEGEDLTLMKCGVLSNDSLVDDPNQQVQHICLDTFMCKVTHDQGLAYIRKAGYFDRAVPTDMRTSEQYFSILSSSAADYRPLEAGVQASS